MIKILYELWCKFVCMSFLFSVFYSQYYSSGFGCLSHCPSALPSYLPLNSAVCFGSVIWYFFPDYRYCFDLHVCSLSEHFDVPESCMWLRLAGNQHFNKDQINLLLWQLLWSRLQFLQSSHERGLISVGPTLLCCFLISISSLWMHIFVLLFFHFHSSLKSFFLSMYVYGWGCRRPEATAL